MQVLFAFLLTVPFSSGFADVTDLQRGVYATSLVAAALSSILMIAPFVALNLSEGWPTTKGEAWLFRVLLTLPPATWDHP